MARSRIIDGPEWSWIDRIRIGDVLISGSGTERIVRSVKYAHGRVRYVEFTILTCSWTKRCYTVLTRSDLKTRKFRPTGVVVELTSDRDLEIKNMDDSNYRSLTCCDVKGVK